MSRSIRPFALIVALALVLSSAAAAVSGASNNKSKGTVNVQLLGINDFHGALEPPAGSAGRVTTVPAGPDGVPPAVTVDAGGVQFLSTHIKKLRATNPNTLVLSAGDLIGASPLLSALFHDEPTIEAMNELGLNLNAVGNHEFDEGVYELMRMQFGGCHPFDGCQDETPFNGANFDFLAANVTWKQTGKTVFPAYRIVTFQGVKIAIVGLVTETTPTIVSPSGISMLDFQDEAVTMNRLIPELRRQGAETIVGLIHEGGFPTGLYNECPGISGAIVDIVNRANDEVDLWISGHTHQAYKCIVDGDPVTSTSSNGRIVTEVDLKISRKTGEPTSVVINNQIVTRTVTADVAQTVLMAHYNVVAAPLRNRVVGSITADILRVKNTQGESRLGNLIADSQLDATQGPDQQAVVAFMNPGGIRTDLIFARTVGNPAEPVDGIVRYEEIFNVQPFGNAMVTMTLNGAQLEQLLEQQFLGDDRILEVSRTFSYAWNPAAAEGSRVDPASIRINGMVVNPTTSYRVTVNSFLADGGDRFPVLVGGTNRIGGEVDLDAVELYFENAGGPVAPPALGRISHTAP